jgi:hypothetical protein
VLLAVFYKIWANNMAREQLLQAAHNGHRTSFSHGVLKILISGYMSGEQFKSCHQVQGQLHSESPVE